MAEDLKTVLQHDEGLGRRRYIDSHAVKSDGKVLIAARHKSEMQGIPTIDAYDRIDEMGRRRRYGETCPNTHVKIGFQNNGQWEKENV